MITRIVKMHFRPEEFDRFIDLFESVKFKIRSCNGCHALSLLQDINNPHILFTYSIWESEDHLNAYRNSELFSTTWKDTKSKFFTKAEAWSVTEHEQTANNNTAQSKLIE